MKVLSNAYNSNDVILEDFVVSKDPEEAQHQTSVVEWKLEATKSCRR